MPQFDRDIREDEVFTFVIQPGDVGDRKDPERCIFARCAKRTMRTPEAWFGLCVGYVRLGDEIVRFNYTKKLYDAIHEFDKPGGVMAPGVYQVKAPRPSTQREAKTEMNRRYNSRNGKNPKAGERRAWHAPRGWGRGVDPGELGQAD
jgi:hypothetical protein